MSTVFDVDILEISIDGELQAAQGVVGQLMLDIPEVAVTDATIEIPVVQGPPGLQNVYIQEDDPSAGWGEAEKGNVWIRTGV